MKKPQFPIRLVALDLDGTTLNPQHELNPATIEAIRAVTARGVVVVLASGRLSHSILPFARQLGLGGVHIGLNGGVAFDSRGQFRHKHLLTLDQLTFAHRLLEREGLFPMVFGAHGLWASQMSEEVGFLHSGGEPDAKTYHPSRLEVITDPAKVITVLPPGPRDKDLARKAEPRVHVVRSGPQFLEFMPPGVSKGAALTEYLADLGIAREQVMAIGDSENDSSMLAAAGFSVAMGNAAPELKAQAHAVTTTNVEDGVAQALHRWILDSNGQ
jgi:Cof subfamily protein (haloacid dehalogenase superfamily)